MNKYIDSEKLIAEIERFSGTEYVGNTLGDDVANGALDYVLEEIIPSLQQEQPDKETILRICKLHKAWSIIAPWENVEDFVTANWNSENIV
jgi:hypothetical protein